MKQYDYIIIGAGSAACVLAYRLSEDRTKRILVLEAGMPDTSWLLKLPLGVAKVWNHPRFNWSYHTEPQPHAEGRRLYYPRGKVVGGSSSINMMAYVRGHRGDYERWRRNGHVGWSYAEVLPYFKRSETYENGPSPYRGSHGPMAVRKGQLQDPIYDAFLGAAGHIGYRLNEDYNGREQEGFARFQFTVGKARRSSAAEAFLRPAMRRENVDLYTYTHVTRILMEGARAAGVEFIRDGALTTVRTDGEIILAAGAINSPQLLMLSGIGPSEHLRRVGVFVRHHLPGVGSNLQDHCGVRVGFTSSVPTVFNYELRLDRLTRSVVAAYTRKSGFAADPPGGMTAFLKSDPGQEMPDLQLFCTSTTPLTREWFPGWRPPGPDGFGVRVCGLRPESRGSLQLASTDPKIAPRIFTNFLSTANDRKTLREAVRIIREIVASPPFKKIGPTETSRKTARTDEEIDAFVRQTVDTLHHPSGTCRIGSDDMAVVDTEFRVHGIEKLRVVDASTMPDLIGGNINAVVIMIAERAADLIRNRPLLSAMEQA